VAYSPEVRTRARNLYVSQFLSVERVATELGVAYQTVAGWTSKAKAKGDDWDRSRAAAMLVSSGPAGMTQHLLLEFAPVYLTTLQDVHNGDFNGLEKADALSKLADFYVKTMKGAGMSDPKLSRLAVAMEVLEGLAEHCRAHRPDLAAGLLELLEPYGRTLGDRYA